MARRKPRTGRNVKKAKLPATGVVCVKGRGSGGGISRSQRKKELRRAPLKNDAVIRPGGNAHGYLTEDLPYEATWRKGGYQDTCRNGTGLITRQSRKGTAEGTAEGGTRRELADKGKRPRRVE